LNEPRIYATKFGINEDKSIHLLFSRAQHIGDDQTKILIDYYISK